METLLEGLHMCCILSLAYIISKIWRDFMPLVQFVNTLYTKWEIMARARLVVVSQTGFVLKRKQKYNILSGVVTIDDSYLADVWTRWWGDDFSKLLCNDLLL